MPTPAPSGIQEHEKEDVAKKDKEIFEATENYNRDYFLSRVADFFHSMEGPNGTLADRSKFSDVMTKNQVLEDSQVGPVHDILLSKPRFVAKDNSLNVGELFECFTELEGELIPFINLMNLKNIFDEAIQRCCEVCDSARPHPEGNVPLFHRIAARVTLMQFKPLYDALEERIVPNQTESILSVDKVYSRFISDLTNALTATEAHDKNNILEMTEQIVGSVRNNMDEALRMMKFKQNPTDSKSIPIPAPMKMPETKPEDGIPFMPSNLLSNRVIEPATHQGLNANQTMGYSLNSPMNFAAHGNPRYLAQPHSPMDFAGHQGSQYSNQHISPMHFTPHHNTPYSNQPINPAMVGQYPMKRQSTGGMKPPSQTNTTKPDESSSWSIFRSMLNMFGGGERLRARIPPKGSTQKRATSEIRCNTYEINSGKPFEKTEPNQIPIVPGRNMVTKVVPLNGHPDYALFNPQNFNNHPANFVTDHEKFGHIEAIQKTLNNAVRADNLPYSEG